MNASRACAFLTAVSVLFLCLTGCGGEEKAGAPFTDADTLDGVWITVKAETVASTGVEVVFHNTTDREDLIYGVEYSVVEEGEDGSWYTLPQVSGSTADGPLIDFHIPAASAIEAGFTEGVDYDPDSELAWYRLPPNEMSCDWADVHGELPPGYYRIFVKVQSELDMPLTEDSPAYYLSAPFTIAE